LLPTPLPTNKTKTNQVHEEFLATNSRENLSHLHIESAGELLLWPARLAHIDRKQLGSGTQLSPR
jgi:hypothetical protein